MKTFLALLFSLWAYSAVATPITDADTVTVNGTKWAQVDLFGMITWNKVNSVCPNGVCSGLLTVNGGKSFDLDGWIWASVDDLTALFNHYGVTPALTAIDGRYENESLWAPAFFADGWRPTEFGPNLNAIDGILADVIDTPFVPFPGRASVVDRSGNSTDEALVNIHVFGFDRGYYTVGAWFYRAPSAAAPIPSTFALLGIGLLGLLYRRRKLT